MALKIEIALHAVFFFNKQSLAGKLDVKESDPTGR